MVEVDEDFLEESISLFLELAEERGLEVSDVALFNIPGRARRLGFTRDKNIWVLRQKYKKAYFDLQRYERDPRRKKNPYKRRKSLGRKKVRVCLWMHPEMLDKVRKMVWDDKRTMTGIMEEALRELFSRREKVRVKVIRKVIRDRKYDQG